MIVIIGGSGFIGTRLCSRLSRSGKIFQIVDKAPSHFFPDKVLLADVRQPLSLGMHVAPSAIINLAAEHRDDVRPIRLYDEVNVNGARNICDLARAQGINKIVFTSSVAVYGFAPLETGECGAIAPFNGYGRTKWEAEQVYREWQAEDPQKRTMIIVRPTVVFGERNRGNVFNLLKQIASGKFIMVGEGLNRKSMAYVENIAAFLEYALDFKPGIHLFNYIDKPDFTMNALVLYVKKLLGRPEKNKLRIPLFLGLMIGSGFDLISKIAKKKFPVSAIRVKKFCADSVYKSMVESTGFIPPVPLMDAMERTIRFEFIEDHKTEHVFYSE